MPATTTILGVSAALMHMAVAASSGCSSALPSNLTPGGATQVFTISSKSVIGNTTTREYRIHLPSTFSAQNNVAAPLILAFHGQLQPAASMETITGLSTPEFNPNAIAVYPEGLDVQDPGQQWLSDPAAPPSSVLDDRIFVTEILNNLTSTLCIDESRIYAAGLSNGGGLTGLLACDPELNKRFAAFAGVSAAMYPDSSLTEPLFVAGCKPQLSGRKLPILEFHGLNDSVIAYDGNNSPSPNSLPLPTWIDAWVERNGCSGAQPKVNTLEDGKVTESKWSCGDAADVVVHRKIEGFGHGWPSSNSQGEPFDNLRVRATAWNASSVVMEWFDRWTLKV